MMKKFRCTNSIRFKVSVFHIKACSEFRTKAMSRILIRASLISSFVFCYLLSSSYTKNLNESRVVVLNSNLRAKKAYKFPLKFCIEVFIVHQEISYSSSHSLHLSALYCGYDPLTFSGYAWFTIRLNLSLSYL